MNNVDLVGNRQDDHAKDGQNSQKEALEKATKEGTVKQPNTHTPSKL